MNSPTTEQKLALLDKLIRVRATLRVSGSSIRIHAHDVIDTLALEVELAEFKDELRELLFGQNELDGNLMPLTPAGASERMYAVHAAQGSLTEYRYLARALYPQVSFYGFQEIPASPGESLIYVAERYCDALKRHHQGQSFILLGSSAGGLLALEMASILIRAGIGPRLLILGDTLDPWCHQLIDGDTLSWYGWVSFVDGHCGRRWLSLIDRESEFWRRSAAERIAWLARKVGGKLRARWSSEDELRRIYETFLKYATTLQNYKICAPNCSVLYLAARETNPDHRLELMNELTSDSFHIVEAAENHMDLVKPSGAQRMAEVIRNALSW